MILDDMIPPPRMAMPSRRHDENVQSLNTTPVKSRKERSSPEKLMPTASPSLSISSSVSWSISGRLVLWLLLTTLTVYLLGLRLSVVLERKYHW